MQRDLPEWLQNTIFTGREGDEDSGGNDEGNNSEDDGQEDEDEDQDSSSDGDSSSTSDDPAALKKALEEERKGRREERRARRKAERERDAAKKSQTETDEAKDLEAERAKRQASEEKTQRLAARLVNKERDDAILAEARRLKFIDPSDALTDTIRSAVIVDQDDEDPSDIEVDEDSVKAAVADLARKKKHLISAPGDGQRSGSNVRQRAGSSDEKTGDEKLKELYPSLKR